MQNISTVQLRALFVGVAQAALINISHPGLYFFLELRLLPQQTCVRLNGISKTLSCFDVVIASDKLQKIGKNVASIAE
jgi:hypothetical protein